MNEFTKEELEDILLLAREAGNYELYIKIKPMIANYCEHNFIGTMQGKASFLYCNQCGKLSS